MITRFTRQDLEKLQRDGKFSRNFYRLVSPASVQYEFRGQYGHPSSFAFVRFDCIPADDLSFETRVSWPPAVSRDYGTMLERAIAEGIADGLLDGLYPFTGCSITLVEVRYDEIGSSEAAFMRATTNAMLELRKHAWTIITKSANT